MLQPPPNFTLFPTRRSSDLGSDPKRSFGRCCVATRRQLSRGCRRSEEHTSELQSHSDLVCRLLLEKKNSIFPAGFVLPFLRRYLDTGPSREDTSCQCNYLYR